MRAIEARRADRRRALDEEVAEYRGRSMQWRARVLEQLVAAGWRILQSRDDKARVLALDDDPRPDYYAKLRSRRERARRHERSS